MLVGLNFSAKMLIMRKMSAFSSTPALITGGSLCASTTFLPLMVTSSRYGGFGIMAGVDAGVETGGVDADSDSGAESCLDLFLDLDLDLDMVLKLRLLCSG